MAMEIFSDSMVLPFARSVVMGVLNVTPDSFSDGGLFLSPEKALERANEMIREGAGIIDIGGESTGPGSRDVGVREELNRVTPVIKAIRRLPAFNRERRSESGKRVFVSVDTWKSEVARQATLAGADMVNDVTALRGGGDLEEGARLARVVAEAGVPIVLMYSKDATPRTTRDAVTYRDVVGTIKKFLDERISFAVTHGIARDKIIIDPGMGAFVSGKPEYSWEILERLREFEDLGCPILVGASRKSFIVGKVEDRLSGSLKAARIALKNGASIIRTHDIAETVALLG